MKLEKEMPFLEHLEELRWRLVKSIIAVVMASIIIYFFSDVVLGLLVEPYNHAIENLNKPQHQKLIFLTPTGGFMVRLKLSLFTGLLVALPVVLYQFWQFVVPGLLDKERKYVPIVAAFSTICFLTGSLFCYFVVLRYAMTFLLGFETSDLDATISVNEYLGFVTMLIMVFGIIFELPILSFFLTRIGLITPAFLRKYRRHAIVIMVILAAIITPPDVLTQILLSVPLIVLYEISILVASVVVKKGKAAESSNV